MKRALLTIMAGAVFTAILILKGRDARPQPPVTGHAMGTTWTLAWRGGAPPQLRSEVSGVLEHWEQVMSQWRADSDLSRFNRGEPASADLDRVLRLADDMREASGGAFDHRMLENAHAAGFGPAGRGIDLSAIGKGFAADRVGEVLRALGVRDFIFEIGGEILAGDGEWEVAIEPPDPEACSIARKVRLRGRALATSGNYRQFRLVTGGLASHLLDPPDGSPVIRPPSSVTVIAGDCATADAWATALFILGPGKAPVPDGVECFWQHPQD